MLIVQYSEEVIVDRQIYFEEVEEGMALPTLHKSPTTQQLVKYAGASGDYYQIHYDQSFARDNGLPDVILHGALKNAFLGQMMTDFIGINGNLKKLSCQYRKMDIPGSPIFGKGTIKKKYIKDEEHIIECEIWLESEAGVVTTPGYAIASLPSKKPRPNSIF